MSRVCCCDVPITFLPFPGVLWVRRAQEKLRLLMVYVASRDGIPEASRRQLLTAIDDRLQSAILHLERLGVDLSQGNKKEQLRLSKARQMELAKHQKALRAADALQLLRYLPALHTTMQALVEGSLDHEEYPCANGDVVVPMPAQSGRSRFLSLLWIWLGFIIPWWDGMLGFLGTFLVIQHRVASSAETSIVGGRVRKTKLQCRSVCQRRFRGCGMIIIGECLGCVLYVAKG